MIRIPDSWVRHIFEPLWDRYESSLRLATLKRLQKQQWRSAAEIKSDQDTKLQQMVRHAAATSPFYAARFKAAGIDPQQVTGIADLAGLPLLTKTDVRENLDSILSGDFPREQLVPAKTGGSTGVALQVYCDRQGIEMRAGAALLADEWSGWSLGEPLAAIWGNPPQATTLKNKLRRQLKDRVIYLDTMRIDDQAIDVRRRQLIHGKSHMFNVHRQGTASDNVNRRCLKSGERGACNFLGERYVERRAGYGDDTELHRVMLP